jgi:hypothetical protein
VGGTELLQQLLVGRGLFQRVEVGPVDVLEQGVAEHVVVAGVPDDRRDELVAEGLSGTPTAFSHDQFVGAGFEFTNNNGLKEADLLNRGLQLLHRLVVEDLAGLPGVGRDRVDAHLGESSARYRS